MDRRYTPIILCLILAVLATVPGCTKKNKPANKSVATSIAPDTLSTAVDTQELILPDVGFLPPPLSGAPEIEPKEVTTRAKESLVPVTEKVLVHEPAPEVADIEFYFENADLDLFIKQISDLYNVTFITDDSINPLPAGAKSIRGNKISFKTQDPLTKREAWNLFNTFLQIAGFTVIDDPNPRIKRIVTLEASRKSPLPAFIGTSPSLLPDSDQMIRYVYFVENTALETLQAVIEPLRSPASGFAVLKEIKAFVLTDRSYNIRSLMNIVKELDKVTMPQAMSVLKLKRADAHDVKKLYEALAQMDEKSLQNQRFFPGRRTPSTHYFPENIGIFAEPRTNSLILLGPEDAIKRIEDFIIKNVDVELSQPYSPLHVVQLRYADAKTVSDIMNEVTKFGATTEAGKAGGVRGGDKYLKPIVFIPEPETNRVVVKGDYDDFIKARDIILKLDEPQPQVAIEVLILAVNVSNTKQLGAQLRSREPGSEGLMGTAAKFQTSGLFNTRGIVENPNGTGINRLLGNLLNLVTGASAGNTIISLGDSLNVWAVVQALETVSNTQILSNPFLVATNKTKATVSLGETRRIITGQIVGTQTVNTFGDAAANLVLNVTPQINSDGMIILDIVVELSQFIGAADPSGNNAERITRKIVTKTIVTNNEVLALGGIIQNITSDSVSKVPILGDIPIIGWLFKNKTHNVNKENLLILLTPRIIEPISEVGLGEYTHAHINDYSDAINSMQVGFEKRDPIHRWFFNSKTPTSDRAPDQFIFKNQATMPENSLPTNRVEKGVTLPYMVTNTTDAKPIAAIKTANNSAPVRKAKKSLIEQIGTEHVAEVRA